MKLGKKLSIGEAQDVAAPSPAERAPVVEAAAEQAVEVARHSRVEKAERTPVVAHAER
jgi:hypothetical protein